MEMSGYAVQCLSGHSYELSAGHPLVEDCKKRAEKFLDALCLSPDQCKCCVEEKRARLFRDAEMCALTGCAMDGNECRDGCIFRKELDALLNLEEQRFEFDRGMNEFFDRTFEMQERGEIATEEVRDLFPSSVIERNTQLAGRASCGCVYHAEEGIPCPHDLALK